MLTESIIGLNMFSLKRVQRFGVFFYIFAHLFAAIYALGLDQHNREYLFLSRESIKNYQGFLERFEEPQLLAVKLTYRKLDESLYHKEVKSLDKLKSDYPEIEIITFYDAYKQLIGENTLKNIRNFLKLHPNLSIPHLEENNLAILIFFKEGIAKDKVHRVIESLENGEIFSQAKPVFSGLPYINYMLDYYSGGIKYRLFPILFVLIFLFIFLLTRRFLTSIFLFVPGFGALIFTLAYIKAFYVEMNLITSITPLVAFVLNLTLAFHVYFTCLESKNIHSALQKKIVPIALMVLTTVVGFGTLVLSNIEAIRQFGYISAVSILVTAALTLLWSFCVFEWSIERQHPRPFHPKWSQMFSKTLSFKVIILISFSVILLAAILYPSIPINTDATTYFPKQSQVVKDLKTMQDEFSGIPIVELVLHKSANQALTYEDLKQIEQIENKLIRKLGVKIVSANQVITEANFLYTQQKGMPLFKLSYDSLRAQVHPLFRDNYPIDLSYRMTLLGKPSGNEAYQEKLSKIREILKNYSGYQLELNGTYYHLMKSQPFLINTLMQSFTISLFVISLIFYIYVRSLRILCAFIFANILPLAAGIIFIRLADFSFNVATVMVFSIALGIVVDSTLHVVHSLRDSEKISYQEYFDTTVIPIVISSLTLIFSFTIFLLDHFVPIQQFGTSLAIALLIALLVDLMVMPTLVIDSNRLKDHFDVER